jgi:hypothetical protein
MGAHDDLAALQQLAQSEPEVSATFDRLATKSAEGVGAELLVLARTSIITIGRCINTFLRERKKRVVIQTPKEKQRFSKTSLTSRSRTS